MGCVYLVTNTVNGKQYVGMTTGTFAQRWWGHCSEARRGVDLYFYRAIRRYGLKVFTHQILFESDDKEALTAREIAEISSRGTTDQMRGYNLTEGGEGGRMTPESHSKWLESMNRPEVKAKKSASMKATLAQPEAIARRTDPAYRARKSAVAKAVYARPETKAKHEAALARTDVRERKSASQKSRWASASPETKSRWEANSKANSLASVRYSPHF